LLFEFRKIVMRNQLNSLFIYTTFVALFFYPQAQLQAQDWPHWGGPNLSGNLDDPDNKLMTSFPEEGPKVLWRKEIGAGYAGPAVVGDRVFVMERVKKVEEPKEGKKKFDAAKLFGPAQGGERIVCRSLTTGEEIWRHEYECPYKIQYPSGPRCTPTVEGDVVIALGAMGHLKCLKIDDGEIVWEKLLTKEYDTKPPVWGYASHPLVEEPFVYVPVGGEGSGVVAFDLETGEEKWKAITTKDIGYSPLAVYTPMQANFPSQLIFWHGEGVTSLNRRDGFENWFHKFPEEPNPSIVTIAKPVFHNNKMLIAEFYKGAMLLELHGDPLPEKSTVSEIWRNFKKNPKLDDAMNCMMSTPVIKDGHAYGVAYTRSGGGLLRCIEIESGEVKWTDRSWLGGEKPTPFAHGFLTQFGPWLEHCYIFNDLGELMVGKLSPEGWEELSRAKLLEPTTFARGRKVVWSHPAYAHGKMVVRNDKEIICVDLEKPE
jgi:outer membrane protein assembly factor BamB